MADAAKEETNCESTEVTARQQLDEQVKEDVKQDMEKSDASLKDLLENDDKNFVAKVLPL